MILPPQIRSSPVPGSEHAMVGRARDTYMASRGLSAIRENPWSLAAFACVVAVLLARAPEHLTNGLLLAEELDFAATGALAWHGFLHPLPAISLWLGIGWFVHVAVIGFVAAFIASERMAVAIPDERVRLLGGVGLTLLPWATEGIYITVLDAHFFLAIYLAALLLVERRSFDIFGATIAALNGPACILLAPLYLLRRDRVSVVVLVCAALQVAMFAGSDRLADLL